MTSFEKAWNAVPMKKYDAIVAERDRYREALESIRRLTDSAQPGFIRERMQVYIDSALAPGPEEPKGGAEMSATEYVTDDQQTLDALRRSLLTMMSDWSEGAYAAGWMSGTEEILHEQSGVWEIRGRAVGWPTGYEYDENFQWVSWDEAGRIFAARNEARAAARGPAADIPLNHAEEDTPDGV